MPCRSAGSDSSRLHHSLVGSPRTSESGDTIGVATGRRRAYSAFRAKRMWSSPGSEVAREQVSRRQSNPHAALRSQNVEVGVDRGGVDVVAGEENREHTYGRGGTNVVSGAASGGACCMIVADQSAYPGRDEQVDAGGLPKVIQRVVVAAQRD